LTGGSGPTCQVHDAAPAQGENDRGEGSKLISEFARPFASVSRAEFSPDGRLLLLGGGDGPPRYSGSFGDAVQVRAVARGQPLTLPFRDRAELGRAVVNAHADRLISIDPEGNAWLWQLNAPQASPRRLPRPSGGVRSARFVSDGKHAVLTDSNGESLLVDA